MTLNQISESVDRLQIQVDLANPKTKMYEMLLLIAIFVLWRTIFQKPQKITIAFSIQKWRCFETFTDFYGLQSVYLIGFNGFALQSYNDTVSVNLRFVLHMTISILHALFGIPSQSGSRLWPRLIRFVLKTWVSLTWSRKSQRKIFTHLESLCIRDLFVLWLPGKNGV